MTDLLVVVSAVLACHANVSAVLFTLILQSSSDHSDHCVWRRGH
jgi:hypothetical protein